jgi:hypothetical protein
MGTQTGFNRRAILKASGLALAGGALLDEPVWASPKNVNTNSSPSTLKITDLRVATLVKPGPSPCPIIRIDTNQDVYGLGEASALSKWHSGTLPAKFTALPSTRC